MKMEKEVKDKKRNKQSVNKNKKKVNKSNSKKNKNSVLNKIKKKLYIFKFNKNVTYTLKEVIVVMVFSLGLGFLTCFSFVKIFSNGKDYKALSNELSKLVDTYYAIKDNYYGELDNEALVDAAIKGMVNAVGDVYTNYTDVNTTDDFMQTISGVYEGIGCTVSMNSDGQIIIIDMFAGSPSEEAGLKAGDIIVGIDGVDYTSKTSQDMADYIKTSKNKNVKITVLREDKEIDIVVKRKEIEIPYVEGEIIEKDGKKIGYINISLFSSVVDVQFSKQLKKLEEQGIDSLVIDVRGNSGGYLSSVTSIINMFLSKGDVIYQLKDNNGVTLKKDNTKENREYPVAVLINGGSASASEILASSLKESYGAFVVGTKSYGKGTVQQTTTLPDGSMIKYTIQNWLTPEGNWINEVGVTPTDVVELEKIFLENPIRENDTQLNKALELLTK